MADQAGVLLQESSVVSLETTRQNDLSFQAVLDPQYFLTGNYASQILRMSNLVHHSPFDHSRILSQGQMIVSEHS